MDIKKDYTLSEYWEKIYSAHHAISFRSETIANEYVKGYSEELDQDLKELGEKCGKYKEKYISYFTDWISSKGRCMSSYIVGPANFPVNKAEKANRSERNKYDAFRLWREKYFKAVNRVKTPSPEDDLEEQMRKLDNNIILNEKVKEFNKVIRKFKKGQITKEDFDQQFKDSGLNEKLKSHIDTMINERYFKGISTLAPEINRLKDRVIELNNRIAAKADFEDIKFDGGYITIEDDRVKIFHDDKPEKEVLQALSGRGFKYSRNWNCHCRKHTRQALIDAKRLKGIAL